MSERTRFTAFITKYALTQGIVETEVEDCFDICDSMVRSFNDMNRVYCYHAPDWHRNRNDAITRAEWMRVRKIASLLKQIAKLDSMSFQ